MNTPPMGMGPAMGTMPPGTMPPSSMPPPGAMMGPMMPGSQMMMPPTAGMGPPMSPIGSMAGPPMGPMPHPMGSVPMMPPPGSMPMMPPGSMPPGSMGMPPGPRPGTPLPHALASGIPYPTLVQEVTNHLNVSVQKRRELTETLNVLTNGEYSEHNKAKMSALRKNNLDNIDWRVPRLMYCKDSKYNREMDPRFAFEVLQKKTADGQILEHQLGVEANAQWADALREAGMQPPPLEKVMRQPVPFVEAVPGYQSEGDVWSRQLELRTLDEAMRGDVSKPMPRPVMFAEDYENYREGKYVKDDCPIA